MQKFKVKGQSAPKTEWKQTDGRTDERTEAISLLPSLMRSVNYLKAVTIKWWVNVCDSQVSYVRKLRVDEAAAAAEAGARLVELK